MLDKNGLTEEAFLRSYRAEDFQRPSVAVDMVIFTVGEAEEKNYRKLSGKSLQVLLIQRGGHPYLGSWALPGGFVRPDECTEKAAERELFEETGVDQVYLEQLYTFSEPKRDPRTWVMSCSYLALLDRERVQLKAGDDAVSAAWFELSYTLLREEKVMLAEGGVKTQVYELVLSGEGEKLVAHIERKTRVNEGVATVTYALESCEGLAFDHGKIIAYGLERLRNKTGYTDIVFQLMPKYFTLTQLQQVYEVILDRPLLKAVFRRKVAHLVVETDQYAQGGGHRPSKLYARDWREDLTAKW